MLLPFPLPQTTSPRPLRCAELCAVCGDQSTGYHYEVPSCNGCKTFFRRTIVSERVFKCHKDGNCTFNKDVRCACRSCRFKKCLQVGMNPRAIQSSRTGFSTAPTPSTSASKETSPSTTPEPLTASTTATASRKRAFDVCSLLDLPPSSSTTPPPEVPFFAKVNNIELTARLADLLSLEDKVESLRLASMEPPTILLDILTRPSALTDTPKSSPAIIAPVIDLDREMFALLEYAKAFNWFCHLNFSDKFALLCERTSALLVLRLAWNRAGTAFQDQLSLLLSPLVETIRKIDVDKASLSLLSALLLSENSSFALSNSAREELTRERDINASCLASYLFQKHGTTGAAQVAQHFSLLWTSLKIADKLKDRVKATQPEHSLCRQLVDNAGHY